MEKRIFNSILAISCTLLFLLMFVPRNIKDCQQQQSVHIYKTIPISYFKIRITPIQKEEVEEDNAETINYITYETPTNYFKSYMAYTEINDKSSLQYLLSRQYSYCGNYGIMMVENRYCIAVGTGFNVKVGDYIDLELDNGNVIECIVGDIKADVHTDNTNIITTSNGCISEFIVYSQNALPYVVGDIYVGTGNISDCCEEWQSSIQYVKVYDKNYLKEVK